MTFSIFFHLNVLKITVVRRALCVPHCFFLFWGSARSPLIFNVLHQHRPHMVPDLHANKRPASAAKHMNPDLHANRSPASAAKHTYHLHCTQLNYKTHRHHRTVCKCRLRSSDASDMCTASTPNIFLLHIQRSAGGSNVQLNILKYFQPLKHDICIIGGFIFFFCNIF